jgi:hypothetical protein
MADGTDKLGGNPQHINSPAAQSYNASTIHDNISVNNTVDAKAVTPRSCKISCQMLTAHQKKAPCCRASIGRAPSGWWAYEYRSADCYAERSRRAGCSVQDRVQGEQQWLRRNKLQIPGRHSKKCTPITDRPCQAQQATSSCSHRTGCDIGIAAHAFQK